MKIKLHQEQLKSTKVSFACRRVDITKAKLLIREPYRPVAGDVVLAAIEQLGQHQRIELTDGRRAALVPGDLVMLAYGNRYAPDQFEGLVPYNLAPCAMVAAGGIAATEVARHHRMREATQIRPLGVLADEKGRALNLSDFSLPAHDSSASWPPLFISCGTSMNSGKTHSACSLIRGFTAMGCSVGATKLTGTGAGGDIWRMHDAGAEKVLDFTDAGLASTYLLDAQSLVATAEILLDNLSVDNVDVIVAEIADGVSHPETCVLLQSALIKSRLSGVLFAAADALGASAGFNWLQQQQLPVLGISGSVTLSPLAMRELNALVPVNAVTAEELASPVDLQAILPDGLFEPRVVMPLRTDIATPTARLVPVTDTTEVCDKSA